MDRIYYLDRRVNHGLAKLTWVSGKEQLDHYVKEVRKFCHEVYLTVCAFHAANERIHANCHLISETLLVHVEKKKVYESGEFEEKQTLHREQVRAQFQAAYETIRDTLATTYETFANDSDEVQAEWVKFVAMVDKKLGDALRQTVKKSLQELSRYVCYNPQQTHEICM